MKQLFPALFAFLAIIIIAQLSYLMLDIHQRRIAEADQKTQATIDHAHFLADQEMMNAKLKVEADYQPLIDQAEKMTDPDLKELNKKQLEELRLMRIRIERDSDLLELHYKYPNEGR